MNQGYFFINKNLRCFSLTQFIDSFQAGGADIQAAVADFFALQIDAHTATTGDIRMTAAVADDSLAIADFTDFGHIFTLSNN